MWITRTSIANPVFATMMMVALCVLGIFSYNRLRVERMPDITIPFVFIQVMYPGAAPEVDDHSVAVDKNELLHGFSGHFEVLQKNCVLPVFVALIVSNAPLPLRAWQAIVVQPGLAQRNNLGMFGKLAKRRSQILRSFMRMRWMPTGNGVNAVVLLGKFDRPGTAFEVRANGNHFDNARRLRPLEALREVAGKVRVIQMRVRVEENSHRANAAGQRLP